MDAHLYDLGQERSARNTRRPTGAFSPSSMILAGWQTMLAAQSFWAEYGQGMARFHANLLSTALLPSLNSAKTTTKR